MCECIAAINTRLAAEKPRWKLDTCVGAQDGIRRPLIRILASGKYMVADFCPFCGARYEASSSSAAGEGEG